MYTISTPPDFSSWRERARTLLEDGVPPSEVVWADADAGQGELFSEAPVPTARVREVDPVAVPKSFLSLAGAVACHSSPQRWALLYRILWRIAKGGERNLLVVATDSDVRRASEFAKEVHRDVHKMRAFVRFRKVGETEAGREQFVSWFEPTHHIVRRNAPFFRKRFTGMDWSILTPEECVHWDGKEIHFTQGVTRDQAPDGDELEDLWRSYYKSIFNPSRLKLKAMQSEMPVKYWKNLPEAPLIQELSREASHRRDSMIETPGVKPRRNTKNLYLQELDSRNQRELDATLLNDGPDPVGSAIRQGQISLKEMREKAACCRACPLWENATQTVFGTGREDAAIMIIGEQPGDQEDIAGQPFVGPAGKLLNEALEKAGLSRESLYLTNAVKHFKWKPNGDAGGRGPRRLHDKANREEMRACRPWLLGEIARVQPEVILTLGNSAAQTLTGFDFQITKERGEITEKLTIDFPGRAFATVHPSFLLRIRDAGTARDERKRFFEEVSFLSRWNNADDGDHRRA